MGHRCAPDDFDDSISQFWNRERIEKTLAEIAIWFSRMDYQRREKEMMRMNSRQDAQTRTLLSVLDANTKALAALTAAVERLSARVERS